MGKQRKCGATKDGINYAKTREVIGTVHPETNIPAFQCQSCEMAGNAEAASRDLQKKMADKGCNLGIMFKYWSLVDESCMRCAMKPPKRTVDDATKDVTVAKAVEILASCENTAAANIGSISARLGALLGITMDDSFSKTFLKIQRGLEKQYKHIHVAKRPKQVIAAMSEKLRDFDIDTSIVGRDKVVFVCSDGQLAISCSVVTVGS